MRKRIAERTNLLALACFAAVSGTESSARTKRLHCITRFQTHTAAWLRQEWPAAVGENFALKLGSGENASIYCIIIRYIRTSRKDALRCCIIYVTLEPKKFAKVENSAEWLKYLDIRYPGWRTQPFCRMVDSNRPFCRMVKKLKISRYPGWRMQPFCVQNGRPFCVDHSAEWSI